MLFMKTSTPSSPPNPSWIDFATFDHLTDARRFKTLLEDMGIEAQVHDERKLQRYWFSARPKAGVHVAVHEDELEKARRQVAERPALKVAFQKALLCPECQSSRIQYPQMTRKNVLPTLLAKTLVAVGAMKHKCYCEDCHFTWPHAVSASLPKHRRASKVSRIPRAAH